MTPETDDERIAKAIMASTYKEALAIHAKNQGKRKAIKMLSELFNRDNK